VVPRQEDGVLFAVPRLCTTALLRVGPTRRFPGARRRARSASPSASRSSSAALAIAARSSVASTSPTPISRWATRC